ncbi:MAG: transposase [Ruminococcus sp.]|nr:transposase [Ruminococcus sp.]
MSVSFKCACCGAELKYSPGSGSLKCEYCGTEFDPQAIEAMAEESEPLRDSINWQSAAHENMSADGSSCTYSCSSCGAEITGDRSLAASFCPYCGNTVVMSDRLEGMLRPDYVIPFGIDKAAAVAKFKDFCKGKPLLPGSFVSSGRIDKIEGLYVPYWLFDANVRGQASFRAERIHTCREGNYQVTRTAHYMLYREGSMEFEHVPVDGTSKLGADVTEAVEPYDMHGAREFSKAYLSGFLADRYDVPEDMAKPRADERIRQSMLSSLKNTCIGYTGVRSTRQSVSSSGGKIVYALMPIWLMTVTYNGKKYTFAMNGQTGKFIGELPVSWGKFWGYFIGITLGLSVILSVVTYLFIK